MELGFVGDGRGQQVVPRFVVLEHDHPHLHWDLMLEDGDTLRTWRLERPPAPAVTVRAEASFDHRLMYLDYAGPVGGGRGSVARWDSGEFDWVSDRAGGVEVRLDGRQLRGQLRIATGEGGCQVTFLPAES
jgi:hypothetical protein